MKKELRINVNGVLCGVMFDDMEADGIKDEGTDYTIRKENEGRTIIY